MDRVKKWEGRKKWSVGGRDGGMERRKKRKGYKRCKRGRVKRDDVEANNPKSEKENTELEERRREQNGTTRDIQRRRGRYR